MREAGVSSSRKAAGGATAEPFLLVYCRFGSLTPLPIHVFRLLRPTATTDKQDLCRPAPRPPQQPAIALLGIASAFAAGSETLQSAFSALPHCRSCRHGLLAHCSGLPPSVDATKLRGHSSRTLTETSQITGPDVLYPYVDGSLFSSDAGRRAGWTGAVCGRDGDYAEVWRRVSVRDGGDQYNGVVSDWVTDDVVDGAVAGASELAAVFGNGGVGRIHDVFEL